ncbi:MAG: glycosyltransferase family 2 protein [Cyanobacteria bacterium P01_F01_bin.33]
MSRWQLPVSVIVPVKNEEQNLPLCLSRLERFEEVIVVDSSSTDRTVEIAESFDARVINFEWNGKYPKKRNYILLNERISSPWVLFIDADEIVTSTFCESLQKELANSTKSGYWLNYTNYFLNRELKYGVAQKKLALFRIGAGLYERIDENLWSKLDMEIHEHPIINGEIGEINARILHRDFRGVGNFLKRHLDYAKWEAARYKSLTSKSVSGASHLTKRQKFKYKNIGNWWYAWFYFIFDYFIKFRILDGRAGFVYAFYKAWYFATIRELILEQPNDTILPECEEIAIWKTKTRSDQ